MSLNNIREVKTRFVYPPVPSRAFDWSAKYEDDDERGPVGWGATEQAAIDDLRAQDDE